MSDVTEVFGGLGNFRVNVRAETPRAVRQRLEMAGAGFAQVIVTSVRADHVALGADGLMAASIYGGNLTRYDQSAGQLTGSGLWSYFGNDRGVGPLVGAGLTATKTYEQWVTDLDLAPFITASTSLASTSLTWTTDRVMTYREALETLQELIGAHPYTGNDLHVDHRTMEITSEPPVWGVFAPAPYDSPATIPLFVSSWAPKDPASGSEVVRCRFEVGESVEEYVSTAIVGGTTSTIGSPRHTYPGGGLDVRQEKYVDDASIPAGSEGAVGAADIDRNDDPAVVVSCFTDQRAVAASVKPGATVRLYAPEVGVYDPATQVTVNGRLTWPALNWVESMRWLIGPGHGVYVRFDDDSVLNLSEWYVPAVGDAEVTFGQPLARRVSGGVVDRGVRSAA